MHLNFNKSLVNSLIAFIFMINVTMPSSIFGQSAVLNLPQPGSMVYTSLHVQPPIICGIHIHPDEPFQFDFIIDEGQTSLSSYEFKQEADKLVRYFLAALAIPEDEQWVNLSPLERDRIVPESFGQTEMGRDLLAQDYILKQLTASLMYPEDPLGDEFWSRIHKRAQELFGTNDIPINTFNKVWIVPESASVFETKKGAFIVEAKLKVMLEEDYKSLKKNNVVTQQEGVDPAAKLASDVIREVLLPEIEREVNQGAQFAPLRQVYYSMILATWYKQSLKQSVLSQVFASQRKTVGVEVEDKEINEKIYNQYLDAYEKGVYNYIKEVYDPTLQEMIPRKYFSGGVELDVDIKKSRNRNRLVQSLANATLSIVTAGMLLIPQASNAEVKLGEVQEASRLTVKNWSNLPEVVSGQNLNSIQKQEIEEIRYFDEFNEKWKAVLKNRRSGSAVLNIDPEDLRDFAPFGGDMLADIRETERTILFGGNFVIEDVKLNGQTPSFGIAIPFINDGFIAITGNPNRSGLLRAVIPFTSFARSSNTSRVKSRTVMPSRESAEEKVDRALAVTFAAREMARNQRLINEFFGDSMQMQYPIVRAAKSRLEEFAGQLIEDDNQIDERFPESDLEPLLGARNDTNEEDKARLPNQNPGGIDLNPAYLELDIDSNVNQISFKLDQEIIDQMNVIGANPVILNVVPVSNIPFLLE